MICANPNEIEIVYSVHSALSGKYNNVLKTAIKLHKVTFYQFPEISGFKQRHAVF